MKRKIKQSDPEHFMMADLNALKPDENADKTTLRAWEDAIRTLERGDSELATAYIAKRLPPFAVNQLTHLRQLNVLYHEVLEEFVRDIGCYCDFKKENRELTSEEFAAMAKRFVRQHPQEVEMTIPRRCIRECPVHRARELTWRRPPGSDVCAPKKL